MDTIQLEEMVYDALEFFVTSPTKFSSRLRESMSHISYRMHLLVDLSMDLEIEAEGLCSMK